MELNPCLATFTGGGHWAIYLISWNSRFFFKNEQQDHYFIKLLEIVNNLGKRAKYSECLFDFF